MPLFLTNITLFLYFLISLFLLLLSVVSIICKSKKLDFIVFLIIGIMMVCFYGLRFPETQIPECIYKDLMLYLV